MKKWMLGIVLVLKLAVLVLMTTVASSGSRPYIPLEVRSVTFQDTDKHFELRVSGLDKFGYTQVEPLVAPTLGVTSRPELKAGDILDCTVVGGIIRCQEK